MALNNKHETFTWISLPEGVLTEDLWCSALMIWFIQCEISLESFVYFFSRFHVCVPVCVCMFSLHLIKHFSENSTWAIFLARGKKWQLLSHHLCARNYSEVRNHASHWGSVCLTSYRAEPFPLLRRMNPQGHNNRDPEMNCIAVVPWIKVSIRGCGSWH